MKSNLFSKIDITRSEQFEKDMKVLMSLPSEVLNKLPEYCIEVWLARTEREEDKIADRTAEDLKVPRARLDHALAISQLFIKHFLKDGDARDDDPANIVADLVEPLGFVPKERASDLSAFLLELKTLTQDRGEKNARRIRYSSSSLPVLRSISTSVDLRVVFDTEYTSDIDPKTFSPTCLGTIPIALIKLGFNEGPTGEVYFQADWQSLQMVMNHLQAVCKQFETAEKSILGKEKKNNG